MKKVRNKKDNPTKGSLEPSKKRSTEQNKKIHYLEEYRSLFDWKMHPLTDRFLDQFCEDLIQWSHKTKDAIRVEDFLSLKGVPSRTYYQWVNKYPQVAEANEEAVQRVLFNREQCGLEEKLNPGFVERTLHIYNQKYRDYMEWKVNLQAKAAGNNSTTPIHVTVEAIPSSPLVPEKKNYEPV